MSEFNPFEAPSTLPMEEEAAGYEFITSEEVDRTIELLEELIGRVQSENIRQILDQAADQVYGLIYFDERSTEDAPTAETEAEAA